MLLLPDTCILYSLPELEGGEGEGESGRGKKGRDRESFLWIDEVLGISNHVDMWGDLEGLRNLPSTHKICIPTCKCCLKGRIVVKIKEDAIFEAKPTHICFLLPHPAS